VEWQTQPFTDTGGVNTLPYKRRADAAEPNQRLFTDRVDVRHVSEINDQSFWD
jgi:hypothetical protein